MKVILEKHKRMQVVINWVKIIVVIISSSLAILAVTSPHEAKAAVEKLDSIAAVVNDDVIAESELSIKTAAFEKKLQHENTSLPPHSTLKKQVLNYLINRKLQLQQAQQYGIFVSDQQLEQTIHKIATQNHLSLSQLREQLKQEGISYAQFRTTTREDLVIAELQNRAVGQGIKISDQEIAHFKRNYGEQLKSNTQYRLEDILIALPETPSPADVAKAKKTAATLLTQLKGGQNFKDLAIAESNSEKALEGGDLGWRTLTALPQIFAKEVASMAKGDVRGPIRAPNGLHIIKLADVKDNEPQKFETEVQFQLLLLKTDAVHDDKAVEQRLKNIRAEILKGKDFGKVASEISQDSLTAGRGGKTDKLLLSKLPGVIAEQINKLKPAQISQPFKTPAGWYLIKLLNKQRANVSEQATNDQIKQLLYRRKFDEQLTVWIQRLRSSAYIHVMSD